MNLQHVYANHISELLYEGHRHYYIKFSEQGGIEFWITTYYTSQRIRTLVLIIDTPDTKKIFMNYCKEDTTLMEELKHHITCIETYPLGLQDDIKARIEVHGGYTIEAYQW